MRRNWDSQLRCEPAHTTCPPTEPQTVIARWGRQYLGVYGFEFGAKFEVPSDLLGAPPTYV